MSISTVKPRRGPPASRHAATRVANNVPPLDFEPLVVRRAEAARMLRVGMTTLKQLLQQKRLRETRIGSTSLVHVSSIREMLGIDHDDAQP